MEPKINEKKRLSINLSLILLIGLPILISFPYLLGIYKPFNYIWDENYFTNLIIVLIWSISYLLSKATLRYNSLSFKDLGLTFNVSWLFKGLLLYLIDIGVLALLAVLAVTLSRIIGFDLSAIQNQLAAHTSVNLIVIVLLTIGNSIYEELVIRATVINTLLKLNSKPLVAVLVSVMIQVSYHPIIYGTTSVFPYLVLAISSFIYSYAYMRWKNITPLIVAHTIHNLVYTFGVV